MIESFKCKETQKLFAQQRSARFVQIEKSALRKLIILHAATALGDLAVIPGNCFEKLQKERLGQYSIRINDQWRVCFKWESNNATDVEIVDYH
jgi:proteic killer suppression protein